ncbi:LamG domain-containing protein [Acidovorax sp. JG5]|uniref:LamG domain-containing protein n=1 Tax=Acidovorax sp. JG5 TaxID=2822718 RepID=UPI001FF08767|nr:LamG domain-containing protein [Acidovorax sp. JG5]
MVLRPNVLGVTARSAGLFPGSAYATSFTGAGYLKLDDPLVGNSNSPICVEASVMRPAGGSDGRFFSRGRDPGADGSWGAGWSVLCECTTDGSLAMGIVASGKGFVCSSAAGAVPADGSAHTVMQYIPGTGIRVYANANLVASMDFTATGLRTSTFPACVGGGVVYTSAAFNGVVDDLSIYTTPLSEARIAAHYEARGNAHFDEVPTYNWSDLATLRSEAKIAASAIVPPFSTRRAAPLQLARDVEHGGLGIIYGTVKEKNTPANTPLRRKVRLMDERSGLVVRETWSDAATGAYEFRGIKQGVPYTVLAYDHAHNYRAFAGDNLLPDPMP